MMMIMMSGKMKILNDSRLYCVYNNAAFSVILLYVDALSS